MLSVLSWPFHFVAAVFRFLFGNLRLPLPQLRFTFFNWHRAFRTRNAGPSDPYNIADRWVRALEDETGALCISRAKALRTASAPSAAGPSTPLPTASAGLRSRYGTVGGRVLPDFTLCSYEEALKTCQKDARIGCIILVSNE